MDLLSNKKHISLKISDSKLKERNRELSILQEMGNFLSASMNLNKLLTGALSKVLEYFDLEAGRIYLIDDTNKQLYLAAHRGMKIRGLENVSFDEGFSGKAVRTKSFIAQHVSELEDKKRAAFLLSKGLKIIICVPLISMDQIVGVMNLGTSKMVELDEKTIDLLTTVGNQIAVAANNAKLYDELKDKIKTLKEKKDMIKLVSYTVAHDLKSPAISVYGLTKRLQEKYALSLGEKGKVYCDHIMKATEQMVALIEEINTYVVTKEVPLNFENIKVKEILDAIRHEFSDKLKQRQIKWLEPDTLPDIMADRLSLSRVFQNFVDNALKYGGKELSEIKIGYEEMDGYHVFSFSDDGVGIKKGKEKIFDPFQRNKTSEGTDGSGLGLAIVKEIAERHQGQVWIDTGSKINIPRIFFN